ncbi:MAG: MucR family transcriptional regulator [Pseudomonadota bacterium]
MKEDTIKTEDLLEHSSRIVAAYVSNNAISHADLPELMASVHGRLKDISKDEVPAERPAPAVPINKSITRNHIVCLEDGKKLKMLKRYLRTHYKMTPNEYRARWGLPADYPMVAPEYAERRSSFAKQIGLGKKRN